MLSLEVQSVLPYEYRVTRLKLSQEGFDLKDTGVRVLSLCFRTNTESLDLGITDL